jgi:uncharacterized protein (DUF934 family)
MPIIRDGRFAADDWLRLETDATAPAGAKVIVSWALFQAEGERLAASNLALGVDVPNTADLAALEPLLGRLELIAVAFPGFADGRGFTLALRLRRVGFEGELRAAGHVIPDQYAYALACGFDAVEISDAQAARQPESHWREALGAISARYQEGYHGAASVFAARRKLADAL